MPGLSQSGPIRCGEPNLAAPPLAAEAPPPCRRPGEDQELQLPACRAAGGGGGREAALEEPLTGGGAPASAPACSLSSVNQNNDCAAGSPGARRRAVSSRGRQSGGRAGGRSLGRAVSVPARKPPGAAAPALSPQPARSSALREPQLLALSGAAAHCCERAGRRWGAGGGPHSPEPPRRAPFLAMWIPTEHEKYGVGECPRANFYHAPVSLSPTQLAPAPGCQSRGLGTAQRVPGLRPRGARRALAPPLRTERSTPIPLPGTSGPQPPGAPLAEFGAAAGRVACQVGPGGQRQGFSRSDPRWPTAARISWGC